MDLYAVVGAGGFGREVMPLVRQMLEKTLLTHPFELVFVEEKSTLSNAFVNHSLVLSMEEFLARSAQHKYFNIAIGNGSVRKRIAEQLIAKGCIPFQINAKNRVELDNNIISQGAIFCPFTTITSNTRIGDFFHANIYSYVAHDCVVGNYVTFAPFVQCNGNVIIEDLVYIGTGAIIKQGTPDNPMIIGQGAIIGMGAVVTKPVAPLSTVVGNPARLLIKKPLTDKV